MTVQAFGTTVLCTVEMEYKILAVILRPRNTRVKLLISREQILSLEMLGFCHSGCAGWRAGTDGNWQCSSRCSRSENRLLSSD